MKRIIELNLRIKNNESGAALVTVLMISVLLGIACIALLSSLGANSKNSTDVLSETKAYYAAESGLQATINVLRNTPAATYSAATANPSLSNWITYTTCNGVTRVWVGPNSCTSAGTSYTIDVSDPDNSSALTTFSTTGTFVANNTGTISFPNSTASNRVTLSFNNVTNCLISFTGNTHCNPNPTDPNPLLSSIQIEKFGTGAQIAALSSGGVRFSINYSITDPRPASRTIKGTISQANTNANIIITFDSPNYILMGTTVNLCQTATTNPCTGSSLSLTNPVSPSVTTASVFMKTTAVEAYRLKVLATGYGPNGAKKQLEGIIQNNFFNNLSSPAAVTMQGSSAGLVFNWTGGGNSSITGANGTTSIGVVDPAGLNTVINGIPNSATVTPAPSVVTDVPDWLATPRNLDALLNQLKTTAQNSGRYFPKPTSPTEPQNIGNLDVNGNPDGTGITYYDGNFNPGNMDGGGILVVKGNLVTNGGWDFKGLLIVTGPEGWNRSGGGNGQISGNVIIAPYTNAQLISNTFSLPPKYSKSGGGTSEIEFDALDLNIALDGTTSISNFMLGVAEK